MKKIWFTTFLLILCALVFCSCGKPNNKISTSDLSSDNEYSKNTALKESTLFDETSEQISPNENNNSSLVSSEENKNNNNSSLVTSEENQSQNPIRSPFNTPDEVFLYKDGQKHIISNSQDIAKIIVVLEDWFPKESVACYRASLAVQDGMIDEIKSDEVAVELFYNNGRTAMDTGEFSKYIKLLIPVKGEFTNNIFPCYQDKYVNPYISGKDYKTDTRMSAVLDALEE